VSEYVGSFRSLGLVRKVLAKEGGPVLRIENRERRHLSSVLSNLERNLLTVTTERFIDLWDF
jgi:hypothetical protein